MHRHCIIIWVGWGGGDSAHTVFIHRTLSFREHHQDGMGWEWLFTILRPRAQLGADKMCHRGSSSGGGTAMDGPANMDMTAQDSLYPYIIHSPY